MKTKYVKVFALLAALAVASAQASVWDTIGDFFTQAPTNSWEAWAYGVYVPQRVETENVKPYEFGGGAALSYWLQPNIGAKLSADWTPSGFTVTSVALSGRGTIHLGQSITVSPFIGAGAGYVFQQPNDPSSVIAVAEGGAVIGIGKFPVKFFGAYQYFTTSDPVERFTLGINYPF